MAKFLTTNGTSYEIENLIKNSKEIIIIVSPYLKFSEVIFNRILSADNRNIKITIIYGKNELSNEQRKKINALQNANLYFTKNLHAKCYLNEENVILSSMNLYDFSEKNNWEMSTLFTSDEDSIMYDEICEEIENIKRSSQVKIESHEQVFRKNPFEELCKFLNIKFKTNDFSIKSHEGFGSINYYIENRYICGNTQLNIDSSRISYELFPESESNKIIEKEISKLNSSDAWEYRNEDRVYFNRPGTEYVNIVVTSSDFL